MAIRLTLLCHAGTSAMRSGAFPAPEDRLDDGGLQKARAWRPSGGASDEILVSPALAARQTAEAIGLDAAIVDSLCDIDHGEWTGRSFETVQQDDPAGLAGWLADPAKATSGGESFAELRERVSPWLATQAGRNLAILAITHPMVIRALLSVAIDLPASAAMRIDLAPLTSVRLSFNRVWRLQALVAG